MNHYAYLALAILALFQATGGQKPPERPLVVPLDVMTPIAPTAVQGGDKKHLAYELHITNMGPSETVLTRIETLGPEGKTLASLDGTALATALARPGLPPLAEKLRIGPGARAVGHLWLTLDAEAPTPVSLRHRIGAKIGEYPEELTVETTTIAVAQKPVEIGPPLRGGEWLAANGPANTSGHRRSLITVDARARIAQRFAIDWVQLRENGRTFTGDQKDNKNYRCYGVDALAVADGVVVAVKDGIPENIPGPMSRAVPITLETIGGNHVILDIGAGRYAFYAHLQPGSLRVKLGEKVRRGQTLGLVGNSGNSTEPHLHFHIGDANSPLGSEGLPYTLASFEVQGNGWGWKSSESKQAPIKRAHSLPLQNEVIRFSPSH